MNKETVTMIMEAGFAVATRLFEAFSNGDEEELKRLSEVLPEQLRSKLQLRLKEEEARRRLSK